MENERRNLFKKRKKEEIVIDPTKELSHEKKFRGKIIFQN